MMSVKKETMFTKKWNSLLDLFGEDKRDIYFTESYAALYEDESSKAECFVYKEGDNVLIFPYIKREIALLSGYYDFETPYGYGGPIANTDDVAFIERAFDAFSSAAGENKMVAGLIRFHPLLDNQAPFKVKSGVVFDRKTVAMDLTPEAEKIWEEQIHSKHRNSIRKAEKAGLLFTVDTDLSCMDIFMNMYKETMERLEVPSFYYFSRGYFEGMKALKGDAFFGIVSLGNKPIAGGLFFKHGIFGHYHLAGSLDEYKEYTPNNFLLYNTALYLKSKGVKLFHLGGGSDTDPDNKLYKFKRRFSDNERSFHIGKIVLNESVYKKVCDIWEEKFPEKKNKYKNFLLKYSY